MWEKYHTKKRQRQLDDIYDAFKLVVNRIPQSDISSHVKDTLINDKYVNPDSITRDRLIGSGYFGLVSKGTMKRFDRTTGNEIIEPVALKRCNQSKTCNTVPCDDKRCWSIEQDLREAGFLVTLRNAYIVELLGVTFDDTYHPVIIMPLYQRNRSLAQYLLSGNKILLTQVQYIMLCHHKYLFFSRRP